MRKALAKVLFALAAANLALAGCNKHADRKEAETGNPSPDMVVAEAQAADTEGYKDYGINGWVDASKDRLSTFAADVDTASYTIMRRKLTEGVLPPGAAVRVEELVNYFRYGYAAPDGARPFSVGIDAAPSPFNPGRHIVRVGVSTKAKSVSERKPPTWSSWSTSPAR